MMEKLTCIAAQACTMVNTDPGNTWVVCSRKHGDVGKKKELVFYQICFMYMRFSVSTSAEKLSCGDCNKFFSWASLPVHMVSAFWWPHLNIWNCLIQRDLLTQILPRLSIGLSLYALFIVSLLGQRPTKTD